MSDFPQIVPMGERAILIKFKPEISPERLQEVLFYKNKLEKDCIKEKVEIINTYNSLLINYLYPIEDAYSEFSRIKTLLRDAKVGKKINSTLFHIPVCYDNEFGLDLQMLSEEKNMSVDEIISLHTKPIYQVYFHGFLPGFLYLGGLHKKLYFPRKKSPRKSVEKGAVGIGENQTGIYPKSSPGGWQILGKTPIELFDKNLENPSPFSAGDLLKFYPVSLEEFNSIRSDIDAGTFQLKTQDYEN